MPYLNAVGHLLRESAPSSRWYTATSPGQVLTGSSLNETLTGGPGHTLVGGDGDDIYGLTGPAAIRELEGGGIDTLSVWGSAVLPDHVENLVMNGGYGWYAIGNDLDNIIYGTDGRQQIDGGRGNDVLIGGDGSDLFIVQRGNGSDLIVDFGRGADQIRLAGFGINNFDEVLAVARQTGDDVMLDLAGGEILVLLNVRISDLEAADFLLEIDLSRYTLTFSDEFDNLDLSITGGAWDSFYNHDPSTSLMSRYHAGEAQIYVDAMFAGTSNRSLGLNPFSISNGVLTITAAPASAESAPYLGGQTYTSGLLTTASSFAQQYGYFEVRAALPAGQGFWPAFWLLPEDGTWPPEIDVFEMLGRDPETFYYSTHSVQDGDHVRQTGQYRVDTTEFHVYGVDWGPETITFYLDGVAIGEVPTPDSMHRPFYMLLNLAVGGSWGGPPDQTTGVGLMQVDYVRAWRTSDTVTELPPVEICWSWTETRVDKGAAKTTETGETALTTPVPEPGDWADDFIVGSGDAIGTWDPVTPHRGLDMWDLAADGAKRIVPGHDADAVILYDEINHDGLAWWQVSLPDNWTAGLLL